jgi:hypothetical protein
MFRIITQDPSSGSIDSYLIKTTRNGSAMLVVCAVGVWWHIQDLWCGGAGVAARGHTPRAQKFFCAAGGGAAPPPPTTGPEYTAKHRQRTQQALLTQCV